MQPILILIFSIISNVSLLSTEKKQPVEFVLVIPSYNNEMWCEKNLQSVFCQTYPHWSLIYINDASTDLTSKNVEKYIDEQHMKHRCTVIHNKTRVGAMENMHRWISTIAPHKVVVSLDGDDWLYDENVLSKLASVYQDPSVWITYGSFIQDPPPKEHNYSFHLYPEEICQKLWFRSYPGQVCQLRTFYAKLFQLIDVDDLKWRGSFYPMNQDVAIMYPMLEMASKGHIRYISDTLYIVNTANPISDTVRNPQLQAYLDLLIRSKRPYKPVNKLFDE